MIIGIGGCSNSGKSELAEKLKNFYTEQKVKILCQDDFVKRRDFLTTVNGHADWEIPSTIIINEYISAVINASSEYDFVICEGLFAYWFEKLTNLYNKKIFLELSEKSFKQRKTNDLRWGKEPDWYIEHIWQSYLEYGKLNPSEQDVLVLNADKKIDLMSVINFITL